MRTCLSHGPLVVHWGKWDTFSDDWQLKIVFCSPMVGGALSRPAERYPYTFGNSEFLKKYPYFLPCAVSATFSALAWVLALVFLKEVGVCVTSVHF
jgi:hypothetical protein